MWTHRQPPVSIVPIAQQLKRLSSVPRSQCGEGHESPLNPCPTCTIQPTWGSSSAASSGAPPTAKEVVWSRSPARPAFSDARVCVLVWWVRDAAVTMKWVQHQANPNDKPGPDFKAMNRLAAVRFAPAPLHNVHCSSPSTPPYLPNFQSTHCRFLVSHRRRGESRPNAAARLDLEVSARWSSPSSRGLWVATLCCSPPAMLETEYLEPPIFVAVTLFPQAARGWTLVCLRALT